MRLHTAGHAQARGGDRHGHRSQKTPAVAVDASVTSVPTDHAALFEPDSPRRRHGIDRVGPPRRAPAPALARYCAQRSEARAHFLGQELRLLPGGEVSALGQLVVVDQLGIRPLRPTPRGWIELVREDAHGNRDATTPLTLKNALPPVLPVETGAGDRRVRQPGDRDVVEDVVAREALGLSVKDARDELQAARVVIEEIRRQADRRIRDSVQRLRSQPHLEAVADALCIDEAQTLVRELLVG